MAVEDIFLYFLPCLIILLMTYDIGNVENTNEKLNYFC